MKANPTPIGWRSETFLKPMISECYGIGDIWGNGGELPEWQGWGGGRQDGRRADADGQADCSRASSVSAALRAAASGVMRISVGV